MSLFFTLTEVGLVILSFWLHGKLTEPWNRLWLLSAAAVILLVILETSLRWAITISIAEGVHAAEAVRRKAVASQGEKVVAVNVSFPADLPPTEIKRSLPKLLKKFHINGIKPVIRRYGWVVEPNQAPACDGLKTGLVWVSFCDPG